jgi:hypothetical protein
MIDELVETIPDFPGKPNQIRCFAHVLNLIAKTIIKQFDPPKKGSNERSGDEATLDIFAERIDIEELETRLDNVEGHDDEDVAGWVDEEELLSEGERAQLNKDLLPVRLVIVKVRLLNLLSIIN